MAWAIENKKAARSSNIANVIAPFKKLTNLRVAFGSEVVHGQELSLRVCAEAPDVSFTPAQRSSRYTLVMCDPDAPDPAQPKMREWLHWLVTDIKNGSVDSGNELLPYTAPTPPRGTHRYILVLFKQTQAAPMAPKTRAKFKVARFAEQFQLQPVSFAFFRASAIA